MKLHEKIYQLRKKSGMSQEETADRLNISRQALSRWENGTAMPDAGNLLELSRLFNVTADYLLNDEFENDSDLPKVKEAGINQIRQTMMILLTLEGITLILQFTAAIILQNRLFSFLSFLPFAAVIGGFEYVFQKNTNKKDEKAKRCRRRFYEISAWLGIYFPVRFLILSLMNLCPRPYHTLTEEGIIWIIYLMTAGMISVLIEKRSQRKNSKKK